VKKKILLQLFIALSSCCFLLSCDERKAGESYFGTYIGKLKPKNSSEIASSPFGIQAGTLDDSLVAVAGEIGVKWTRLGTSWPSIEKVKGEYTWEQTDKAFETALKNGITPFVTLGGGHRLYSELTTYDDPKLAEIYGKKPAPPVRDPVAMAAFLKFVKAAVERYKDQIDYWEVWNEPNHRNYWGSEPDGKEYGKLLLETAKLIKETDPGCKVIGGAMAGIDPKFADDFLSTGTDQVIDIISYHNYGAVPEERVYLALDLWEVMKKYRTGIELWQGECGYPSHSSTRDFRGRAPWGLNIQAKWLLRQSFTDIYYCRATLSNYFKLAHTDGRGELPTRSNLREIDQIFGYPERAGSRTKTVGVNEKCLLTNPGQDKKPGFFAYQNLCAIWQPGYRPYPVKYKVDILNEGIFYGIGPEDDTFPSIPLVVSFRDENGKDMVAWWLPWNAQEYVPIPATVKLTLEGVHFAEPVLVNLLTGYIYEAGSYVEENGSVVFQNLPLTDYPLVLVDKKHINFK